MRIGKTTGRTGWTVAVIGTLAIAASGTASAQSPSAEPPASGAPESGAPASTPPLLVPSIDLSQVGGPGEGQLNIINWIGYAEAGANLPEYDWVTPFTEQTGCVVNSKVDDTSDQMVSDMRQGGGSVYDGVS